jgi:hypothetical protein
MHPSALPRLSGQESSRLAPRAYWAIRAFCAAATRASVQNVQFERNAFLTLEHVELSFPPQKNIIGVCRPEKSNDRK